MKIVKLLTPTLLTIFLLIPGTASATQSPSSAPQAKAAGKDQSTKPSPQDIADAKSKGLVWVNSSTHVYHKDGSFYGTTKRGKFMTEDEAVKAGNRAAKEPGTKKN